MKEKQLKSTASNAAAMVAIAPRTGPSHFHNGSEAGVPLKALGAVCVAGFVDSTGSRSVLEGLTGFEDAVVLGEVGGAAGSSDGDGKGVLGTGDLLGIGSRKSEILGQGVSLVRISIF